MPRYVYTYRNVKSRNVVTGSRLARIKMPQNPFVDYHLRIVSNINKEMVRRTPGWWVTHRRKLAHLIKNVGVSDPLEMRAVPKTLIKGSLPERIVFQWLLTAHFVPGADFTFQPSIQGGRLELGGLVADFLFTHLKLIIQVQGPTHLQFMRMHKDQEQVQTLEAMGYQVIFLWEDVINNQVLFEEQMRGIFDLRPVYGAGSSVYATWMDVSEDENFKLNQVSTQIGQLTAALS